MNTAQPQRDPKLTKELRELLEKECQVHEDYAEAIGKEQEALTKFKPEQIVDLTTKREKLFTEMAALHDKRLAFLSRFPDSETLRLSELIVKHCHPDDARLIAPIVQRLKKLIEQSKTLSIEFNRVVDFSMTLVSGTLSILWSATQNVTKAYSKKGVVKERFQPLKGEMLEKA